jgi:hypothetical protein
VVVVAEVVAVVMVVVMVMVMVMVVLVLVRDECQSVESIKRKMELNGFCYEYEHCLLAIHF